jgi:Undecaprenyl-phosphate glucose phosphotransferase
MPEIADQSPRFSSIYVADSRVFDRHELREVERTKSVHALLFRYALIEASAIATASYSASFVYGKAPWSGWTAGAAYIASALLLAVGIQTVSTSLKHYVGFQMQPVRRVLWNASTAVTIAFSLLLSGLFLLKVATDYSRGAFLLQLIIVFTTVLGVRSVAHARIRAAIANNWAQARRAIVFGTPQECASACPALAEAGIRVVCSLSIPVNDLSFGGESSRAARRRILETCRGARAEEVVIMTKSEELERTARLVEFLCELPVSVHLVPIDTGMLFRSARLGELGKLITVQLFSSPMSIVERVLKRSFDLVAASVGLIVLAPLLIVVAITIKLDSRGPVIFRQTRHGYNNDVFRVFKFRTMMADEDGHVFSQAKKNDSRVTRVGRVLRRTNVDELPQLANVLLGEMSIVGPRPHPVAMNQIFEPHISPLSRRHNVKPGITGWAQVNGHRGETDTLEKMERRFEYDIYYVDNWSFAFDVKIILMTLFSKSAYRNAF